VAQGPIYYTDVALDHDPDDLRIFKSFSIYYLLIYLLLAVITRRPDRVS